MLTFHSGGSMIITTLRWEGGKKKVFQLPAFLDCLDSRFSEFCGVIMCQRKAGGGQLLMGSLIKLVRQLVLS